VILLCGCSKPNWSLIPSLLMMSIVMLFVKGTLYCYSIKLIKSCKCHMEPIILFMQFHYTVRWQLLSWQQNNYQDTEMSWKPDLLVTGSCWLMTYATYDCLTLRPVVQLKDDHNIITQYYIHMVIITYANLWPVGHNQSRS